MCKSIAYKYEQEIRAIFHDAGVVDSKRIQSDPPPGYFVPIDLQRLSSNIVASPLAPLWFLTLVSDVCAVFDWKTEVRSSILSDLPVF